MSAPKKERYAPCVETGAVTDNAEVLSTLPMWAQSAAGYAKEWSASKGSVADICKRLRELAGDRRARGAMMSEFLSPPLRLMQTVAMHGFHLRFEGAKAEVAAVKAAPWLKAEAVMMARDLAREWFLTDNACAFWKEGGKRASGAPAVTVLDTERIVSWEDGYDGEHLKIQSTPDGNAMEADAERFGSKWADAMKAGKPVELLAKDGEFYRIRTRAKRGGGLALPSLEGALPLVGMLELLALADRAAAWEHRNLIRQWLIGHDIRYGGRAGMTDHFIKEGHVKALKKKMAGKVGPQDLYTNFDWTIKHVFLPTEYFKKEKYEGAVMRMAMWFGPVGRLMRDEIHDNDIPLVRAWVDGEREVIGGMVEDIVNAKEYWGGKVPASRISVGWSPVTMMTPKMILELARFASAQGAIGQQTTREMLGFGNDREQQRLAAEARKPKGHVPNFEQKQGIVAAGSTPEGGRPAEH